MNKIKNNNLMNKSDCSVVDLHTKTNINNDV